MTDIAKFPKYGEMLVKRLARPGELTAKLFNCFQCQRAVRYQPDLADAKHELKSFADALDRHPNKFTETFVSAASPGIIATTLLRDENNPDCKTDAEYVFGIAREMKKEYELIVGRVTSCNSMRRIWPWSAPSCSRTGRLAISSIASRSISRR